MLGLVTSFLLCVVVLVGLYYSSLVAATLSVLSFVPLYWRRKRNYMPVLSWEEEQAVTLLLQRLPLTAAETRLLGKFFTSIHANSDFNGRAMARAQVLEKSSYDKARSALIKELAAYAYKTRSFRLQWLDVAEKAWLAWQKKEPPLCKLTREQLRGLESYARSSFSPFAVACGEHCPKELSEAVAAQDRAKAWCSEVLQALLRGDGLEDPMERPLTGDLCAYTLANDRYIMGSERPKIIQWLYLRAGGADATHMSLVLDGGGESHMWGNPMSIYAQTPFTIGSFGNSFTRPNINRYINGTRWGAAIEKAYGGGSTWEQIAMGEYRRVVEEWHVQNRSFLKTLRNDAVYRILLALIINVISPFKKPWRERAQFRADLFKKANQVACSEFVIKAALQCADGLGKALAKRLIESGVDEKVNPSGEEIVDPQIDPRRRTARYSPGMLVHRMLKLGLSTELPPSPLYNAMIE